MKIYNATFDYGDTKSLSTIVAEKTKALARVQAKKNIKINFGLGNPSNLELNAIIFGADGPGKSLNKLKRKK
jgi:hypothetical protein